VDLGDFYEIMQMRLLKMYPQPSVRLEERIRKSTAVGRGAPLLASSRMSALLIQISDDFRVTLIFAD
jgi:hypothetical protein